MDTKPESVNLLNTCTECADLVFTSCADAEIAPQGGLSASTLYYWRIEDQHGNVWKGSATTSENGVLTLESDMFPDGLFDKAIGTLTLEIRVNENDIDTVELIFSGITYDCVKMSFESNQVLNEYEYY